MVVAMEINHYIHVAKQHDYCRIMTIIPSDALPLIKGGRSSKITYIAIIYTVRGHLKGKMSAILYFDRFHGYRVDSAMVPKLKSIFMTK